MDRDREFVLHLYRTILGREPSQGEVDGWVAAARDLSYDEMDAMFRDGDEGRAKAPPKTVPYFPLGHYYSPMANGELAVGLRPPHTVRPEQLLDLDFDIEAQKRFWIDNADIIHSIDISAQPDGGRRYHYPNDFYPEADAVMLQTMVLAFRPRRLIEIGSGFSSACILDALDRPDAPDTALVFIDPEPQRLYGLLRDTDHERVTVYSRCLQDVDAAIFTELQADDILFIDSSHVLKTASDVCYSLFEIFPRLPTGVVIHIHDIHYPFEYPPEWVALGWSWNEAYALRAFLMNNSRYEILFSNSGMRILAPDLVKTKPQFLYSPGASLWLRKL